MRGDEDTKAELHQQLDVCYISHVIFFNICGFFASFSPQFGCTVEETGFNLIVIITIILVSYVIYIFLLMYENV